jgi:hypothetical protein
MKHKLFFLCLSLFAGICFARNNLPSCSGNDVSKWNNCFGIEVFNHGYQFSGQYKDGKLNGLGVHYASNGSVLFAGSFRNGQWENPQPLDLKNFPFFNPNKNLNNRQIFDTYICRRNSEIGYIYRGDKWEGTNFKQEKPFFLNINSERIIDHDSFFSIGIINTPEKCTKPYNATSPEIHQCSGVMSTFTFNDKTYEGAFSSIAGASQMGSRDTIVTGIFKCQKIN